MDLYPLPVEPVVLPGPVDSGWARVIRHGPLTIEQVLGRGLEQMLAEDERDRQAADPVLWAWEHRPRRLIDRLLGR
jgi:hypothetical protein